MASYFTPCSSVSIVNFEHLIAGWEPLKAEPNKKPQQQLAMQQLAMLSEHHLGMEW